MSLVNHKEVAQVTLFIVHGKAPIDKRPLAHVQLREKSIALDGRIYARQINTARLRQELLINMAAADNHDLWRIGGELQCVLHGRSNIASIGDKSGLPRQHDTLPARQGAPDRLPGSAPHDHRLAHRDLLEPFEIFRQPPGQITVFANNVIR